MLAPPHTLTRPCLGWALTPFIRLQLCLQVFGGYVEFCLLTLRCLGLTFPTAAVKATAQTAAAVAAGEEATDNEQCLGERIPTGTMWPQGEDRSRAAVYVTDAKGILQEKAVDKRGFAGCKEAEIIKSNL